MTEIGRRLGGLGEEQQVRVGRKKNREREDKPVACLLNNSHASSLPHFASYILDTPQHAGL
jgi:hypothetical protein